VASPQPAGTDRLVPGQRGAVSLGSQAREARYRQGLRVIAYDSRIRVLQEFTTDSAKITEAVKKIRPGSESNRMIDAVMDGARLLRSRPQNPPADHAADRAKPAT